MVKLASDLVDKKGVAESSADQYIRTLVMLNNKTPFKSLVFLKDVEGVMKRIDEYAMSTRKNIVGAIASVLSTYNQPAYKKAYEFYSVKLKEMIADLEKSRGDTMVKTDKEKDNWIEWEEVQKKRDALREEVDKFASSKNITIQQYDKLLQYLILCLYTYIPPRRNMDYQEMWVVRQWTDKMPTDRNYLDLHEQRFIFNKYKTARTAGTQTIDIPASDDVPLKDAIVMYLRHNAHYRASKNKATEFRFLTKADGTPLTAVNAITRVLNRLFGKKIGSSMLRHSYLSAKYGKVMEEMKEDADLMAHSTDIQKDYIRGGGEIQMNVIELV
jgi:integrase